MKKSAIISSVVLATILATMYGNAFALEKDNDVQAKSIEKLIGDNRFETSIKVSKEGWNQCENLVLVNANAIVDALSATPFAKMKNAPILLTEKYYLRYDIEDEIKRLKVKNVYIVGGQGVVAEEVEEALQKLGINVYRISGNDRYETSLKVADKIKEEGNVSKVAVVNGQNGLADALSIAAPAAEANMPIILGNKYELDKGLQWIKNNEIKDSYVVGGEGVISKEVENQLPNVTRLGGTDRNETNGKVLDYFYNDIDINTIYTAKDGRNNLTELVDALSVGPLAAREKSPVILAGSSLNKVQKDFLEKKQPRFLIEVGGGISKNTIDEICKSLTTIVRFDVSNEEDLEKAIKKAQPRDIINFKLEKDKDDPIKIKTDKKITINLYGNINNDLTVNMSSGDFFNFATINGNVILEDIDNGNFINEGKIKNMIVKDQDGAIIVNKEIGNIEKINIADNVKVGIGGLINEIYLQGKNSDINLNAKVENIIIKGESNKIFITQECKINNISVDEQGKNLNLENKGVIKNFNIQAENVKINNFKGKIESLKATKEIQIDGKENINNINDNNEKKEDIKEEKTEEQALKEIKKLIIKDELKGEDLIKFFKKYDEFFENVIDGYGDKYLAKLKSVNINKLSDVQSIIETVNMDKVIGENISSEKVNDYIITKIKFEDDIKSVNISLGDKNIPDELKEQPLFKLLQKNSIQLFKDENNNWKIKIDDKEYKFERNLDKDIECKKDFMCCEIPMNNNENSEKVNLVIKISSESLEILFNNIKDIKILNNYIDNIDIEPIFEINKK